MSVMDFPSQAKQQQLALMIGYFFHCFTENILCNILHTQVWSS